MRVGAARELQQKAFRKGGTERAKLVIKLGTIGESLRCALAAIGEYCLPGRVDYGLDRRKDGCSLELTGAGDGVGSSERRRDVTGLSRKKRVQGWVGDVVDEEIRL